MRPTIKVIRRFSLRRVKNVCKQLTSIQVSRVSCLSPMGKTEFSSTAKNRANSVSALRNTSRCPRRIHAHGMTAPVFFKRQATQTLLTFRSQSNFFSYIELCRLSVSIFLKWNIYFFQMNMVECVAAIIRRH